MAESEEKPKSLLTRLKDENEKFDLTLNIQKTKIMASGPITSWQIEGGKVEAVKKFYFLGLQNHFEQLLQSSRGIILLMPIETKGLYSQSYGFSSSHPQMWVEQ